MFGHLTFDLVEQGHMTMVENVSLSVLSITTPLTQTPLPFLKAVYPVQSTPQPTMRHANLDAGARQATTQRMRLPPHVLHALWIHIEMYGLKQPTSCAQFAISTRQLMDSQVQPIVFASPDIMETV
jgi:hypothetical protein